MADEKPKGLFGKAIDALTNRDEKAAAEEAAKKAAEAQAQAAKAATEKAAAQQQAQAAQQRAAAAEAKAKALEAEKKAQDMSKMQQQRAADEAAFAAKAAAAAMPKIIAEHKVKAGETLSEIALKHYGKAIKDYWMVIYEANKATIGSSPNVIKEGMVLKIPELPSELKK
jgi:nucleoid-associated protein YgaU